MEEVGVSAGAGLRRCPNFLSPNRFSAASSTKRQRATLDPGAVAARPLFVGGYTKFLLSILSI
jgi:hypothetical protein